MHGAKVKIIKSPINIKFMETAGQKCLVQGVSSGCYWMFTLLKHWAYRNISWYCIICVCMGGGAKQNEKKNGEW
jgi:hypothetical protein